MLFEGFARVWSSVLLAEELRPGKPVKVLVAGTPVVLFRDASGRARALLDRCPHRGVALSLGKVKGDCVECPFHGWQLDGAGHVCKVPWNPDAKLDTLHGVSFPVQERGGQLWLYSDAVETAPDAPEVHESFEDPSMRVSGTALDMEAHWTRVMENMLDWPHLPFVHSGTIGRQFQGRTDARMDVRWEVTSWGARTHMELDGEARPGRLDFRWPNQMNLFVPVPTGPMVLAAVCVPLGAERTRLLLLSTRGMLKHRLFDGLFHWMNRRIALEDKAVVESSYPAVMPPASEEQSVRTDGLTLYYRKRYFAELHGTGVEPSGRRKLRMLPTERDAG